MQTAVLPVIDVGCVSAGVDVTEIVRTVPVPHELTAASETVPPPAPGVALIDDVVEVPDHPPGKVQV